MGIAVISGVIESIKSAASIQKPSGAPKWESHTPGTVTPTGPSGIIPSRFLACVNREETANKLRATFGPLCAQGVIIEVFASQNVKAAQQADVVLLWYKFDVHSKGKRLTAFVQLQATSSAHHPCRAGNTRCSGGKAPD
jgi:pyrroline-5-carboxylate reductase